MLEPVANESSLLFYRVSKSDRACQKIEYYDEPSRSGAAPLPTAQDALSRLNAAISDATRWQLSFSTTERIIAELAVRGHVSPFVIKYYCVGTEQPALRRVASFFVYEATKDKKPLLSGCLDYPEPLNRVRVEAFFRDAETNPCWTAWAFKSFQTVHTVSPVLRISASDSHYVGLHTEAKLLPFPEGFIKGGVPFGAEEQFLALADLEEADHWSTALHQHERIFAQWNRVSRYPSLERVFLCGDPGAGKELWYNAIKGGVRGRLSGDWAAVSAALSTKQLEALLYGQRQGHLERPGYLKRCRGGGIFLDEIGKSDRDFRAGLLRVLETKEYIPQDGEPAKFDHILFIFASTPEDKARAAQPADFWTRIDIELDLPEPVRLQPKELQPLSVYDKARFYALFAHFWFNQSGVVEEITSATIHDPQAVRRHFLTRIVMPLLTSIKTACSELNTECPDLPNYLPISPRRIRALASVLANEYHWLGSADGHTDAAATGAMKAWDDHRNQLAKEFVEALRFDNLNRAKAT